ncbi:diguanylate cyclase [Oxalobacteraceae bacterium R-40]|uniref:Diguanylate cyclase n=1 Tax=Keguizhuia sedimenti TaxID=3064264 RepID=A0ABU1BR67_9BURK|nr:diguanylate cyclase [Oxalobacteraceae bacterium R-40]
MTPVAPASKVLIVNDDIHSAIALRSVLSEAIDRKEYEVVLAYSGEDALRQVMRQEFAVILLDVKMPIMDGFETADAIHSNPRLASLPIIFVTAYFDDDFHRLQGYQKGAADYIFMPVNPKILQTKISIFVEMARQKQTLQNQKEELYQINNKLRIQRLTSLANQVSLLADEAGNQNEAVQLPETSAQKDSLTGVLNRPMMYEHLEYAVGYATRYHEQFALVILEIDDLDAPEATFGMPVADFVLIEIANRISFSVRLADPIARIEDNQFAILLKSIAGLREAVQVMEKLASEISKPYLLEKGTMEIDFQIGLAMYPQDGVRPCDIMDTAKSSLYPGKQFVTA